MESAVLGLEKQIEVDEVELAREAYHPKFLKKFPGLLITKKPSRWSREVRLATDKEVVKFNAHWKVLDLIDKKEVIKNTQVEYDNHKDIHAFGIPSPKPIGFYDIHFRSRRTWGFWTIFPGFVMEYIPGLTMGQVKETMPQDYPHIEELWKAEIEKAESLGWNTKDSNYKGNAIWCLEKKKIYLLDFESWERK